MAITLVKTKRMTRSAGSSSFNGCNSFNKVAEEIVLVVEGVLLLAEAVGAEEEAGDSALAIRSHYFDASDSSGVMTPSRFRSCFANSDAFASDQLREYSCIATWPS